MKERIKFDSIDKQIKEILYEYIKTESFTSSRKENEASDFFINYFSEIPYFKENPEYFGLYKIENDPYDRAVSYAMVKGASEKTVILFHHNDVVGVEDFKALKSFCFMPEKLEEELFKIRESLSDEVKEDLDSGNYIFGRGACDMKGGGSIQFALLERYSKLKDLDVNIMLVVVPDEENLSAGMRGAVKLLVELKEKYNLDYKFLINSEPHQREEKNTGVFSVGSIGKLMPFAYVRGYLTHVGKVFKGFNPTNLLSEIVRRTELNTDFIENIEGEVAPPPTWLYVKDEKIEYDVSIPLSASGCLSVLTLNKSLDNVMNDFKNICEESFDQVIYDMNEKYKRYCDLTNCDFKGLPWETKVVDFKELYNEAVNGYGDEFIKKYENKKRELTKEFQNNSKTMIKCNFNLLEFVFEYIKDSSPMVVYGLVPPYYPNVTNGFLADIPENIKNITETLNDFTLKEFNQEYEKELFFGSISDLSYTSIKNGKETIEALEKTMPLLGDIYSLPINEIEKISMPCINIGPWGKDFHKMTERVNKEDLYFRTPKIIDKAVQIISEI